MEHYIHVRKLFGDIHQASGIDAESSLALHIAQLNAGHEGVFGVGGCDCKYIPLHREKEIVENSESILRVYHLAHTREGGIEGFGGYFEFHIFGFI